MFFFFLFVKKSFSTRDYDDLICVRLFVVYQPSKFVQFNRPGSKLMYHFGEFTCSLNQEEEGVSTTDSRLRPDLRLMEQQKFDEANRIKQQLEELQRTRRKAREQESQEASEAGRVYEGYKPRWFDETEDEHSDGKIFVYKGGYWEAKEKQDWTTCPKIYLDSV